MPLRVAFFGSPEFAVPSLEACVARFEVALVVTQPDRPAGRGRKLAPTAVHQQAGVHGLEVVQYERAQRPALEARLREHAVEVLVVVAFGHILKASTLHAVPHGAVNVHASLLPRWRGVAPIERAILAGDAKTGVSLMALDAGVDTGPVLGTWETAIAPEETRVTLTGRLAQAGAELLVAHLENYTRGELLPVPQPLQGATYAPRLEKSEGRLDFERSPRQLADQVRGLFEWPGAFTTLAGEPLKVHTAQPSTVPAAAAPGTIVLADARAGVHVACAGGALELIEVQMAGKARVAARDLVRGRVLTPGLRLGAP